MVNTEWIFEFSQMFTKRSDPPPRVNLCFEEKYGCYEGFWWWCDTKKKLWNWVPLEEITPFNTRLTTKEKSFQYHSLKPQINSKNKLATFESKLSLSSSGIYFLIILPWCSFDKSQQLNKSPRNILVKHL